MDEVAIAAQVPRRMLEPVDTSSPEGRAFLQHIYGDDPPDIEALALAVFGEAP